MQETTPNNLVEIVVIGTAIMTVFALTVILITARLHKRKRKCKHVGGWYLISNTGKKIDLDSNWVDVSDADLGNVFCNGCKKSLMEINS